MLVREWGFVVEFGGGVNDEMVFWVAELVLLFGEGVRWVRVARGWGVELGWRR